MDGRVSEFTVGDLEGCAQVFASVFNAAPWNDGWTLESARSRLSEIIDTPGFVGLVFKTDEVLGFVLGCCEQWYDGCHFCVKEMCVRSDKQGQGIGHRLLTSLERRLEAMGVVQVYLLTAKGEPAEAFYARHGYRVSSRIVLMSRRL